MSNFIPSSNPMYMSTIRDVLGAADLGYYRGRTYNNVQTGGLTTISQSPSMDEFRGLGSGIVSGIITSENFNNVFGYSSAYFNQPAPQVGAITPEYFNGAFIDGIYHLNDQGNFWVVLRGNRPQNFWTQLHVHNVIIVNSANAGVFDYGIGGLDVTRWVFSGGMGVGNFAFDMY